MNTLFIFIFMLILILITVICVFTKFRYLESINFETFVTPMLVIKTITNPNKVSIEDPESIGIAKQFKGLRGIVDSGGFQLAITDPMNAKGDQTIITIFQKKACMMFLKFTNSKTNKIACFDKTHIDYIKIIYTASDLPMPEIEVINEQYIDTTFDQNYNMLFLYIRKPFTNIDSTCKYSIVDLNSLDIFKLKYFWPYVLPSPIYLIDWIPNITSSGKDSIRNVLLFDLLLIANQDPIPEIYPILNRIRQVHFDESVYNYYSYVLKDSEIIETFIQPECYNSSIVQKGLCESPYDMNGILKDKQDIWDKRCENNNECPFLQNNKGGCINGYCEMPIGITRLSYTKYIGKPWCENCPIENPTCCSEKKNSKYVFQ